MYQPAALPLSKLQLALTQYIEESLTVLIMVTHRKCDMRCFIGDPGKLRLQSGSWLLEEVS